MSNLRQKSKLKQPLKLLMDQPITEKKFKLLFIPKRMTEKNKLKDSQTCMSRTFQPAIPSRTLEISFKSLETSSHVQLREMDQTVDTSCSRHMTKPSLPLRPLMPRKRLKERFCSFVSSSTRVKIRRALHRQLQSLSNFKKLTSQTFSLETFQSMSLKMTSRKK